MLIALALAATVQTASAQSSSGPAESIRLCSQKAACSFVVAYPAERLMFASTAGARPPPRSGFLCQGGWVNQTHPGSAGAEILIQAADGTWAKRWKPLAPSQCHEFHGILNIRLRAIDVQSAWHAIYQQASD